MSGPETVAGPKRLSGGCLCGAVAYEVDDAFLYAMYCHCSQCRRSTGSAFKPLAGIERGKFALVKGQSSVFRYGDDSGHDAPCHDAHCGVCGSLLYSVVRGGAYVHVPMGTLVGEPSIRPSKHIFVGSKARWFEITDGLPQFEALPDL